MFFGRNENKIQVDFGFKEFYKYYKNVTNNFIDKKICKELLKEYNEKMLKLVIYEGYDHSLRPRLGSIRIKKFDNSLRLNKEGEIENKLRPDWGKTRKRWVELYGNISGEELKEIKNKPIIYHLNEHTDGIVLKWYWDKVTCTIINQSAYKLEILRLVKREAAKAWKEIPSLKDIYYE